MNTKPIEHNHPQDILLHEDCPRCRLNTAAPDLLNVLEQILRASESDNNGAYMGEAVLCRYFTSAAKYAINKARGEA